METNAAIYADLDRILVSREEIHAAVVELGKCKEFAPLAGGP